MLATVGPPVVPQPDVTALAMQIAKALEERKAAIAAEMEHLRAVSANPQLFSSSSSVFPVRSAAFPLKDIMEQAQTLTKLTISSSDPTPSSDPAAAHFFESSLVSLLDHSLEDWTFESELKASEQAAFESIDSELDRLRAASLSDAESDIELTDTSSKLAQSLRDKRYAVEVQMKEAAERAPLLLADLEEIREVVKELEDLAREREREDKRARARAARASPASDEGPEGEGVGPEDEASLVGTSKTRKKNGKTSLQLRSEKKATRNARGRESRIEEEAEDLEKKALQDLREAESEPTAPPGKPMWRDPATGLFVPVDGRREYLRGSQAYKDCWEGVLAKCIKTIGKQELERRVNVLTHVTSTYATPAQGFCALAECGGVVQQAAAKLKLEGYREEMQLAVEVCNVEQYVRVSSSSAEKKAAKMEKKKQEAAAALQAASPKLETEKGPPVAEPSPPVAEPSPPVAEPSPPKQGLWKDPVSGKVMDSAQRNAFLLTSPSYKQCWEEVLGRLVKNAEKGAIEKGIRKICAALSKTNPKVTAEVAFCALAECAGATEKAIVKLQNPAYVDEMKIADECCRVSQYVRVSKRSKKKDPNSSESREGGENTVEHLAGGSEDPSDGNSAAGREP